MLYEDAAVQWVPEGVEALGLQVDFDDTLQEFEVDEIPGGSTPVPQEVESPAPAQPPRSDGQRQDTRDGTAAGPTAGEPGEEGRRRRRRRLRARGRGRWRVEWDEDAAVVAAAAADRMQE